jgi:hypothetical protein
LFGCGLRAVFASRMEIKPPDFAALEEKLIYFE